MHKYLAITSFLLLLLSGTTAFAGIPEERYHDYRAQYLAVDLLKMQEFHLQQARTKLSNNQPANAWGDLAYLLCHIPNHHEALTQMIEIAPHINKNEEMAKFFDKAISEFPDDAIAHALYGKFLYKTGDNENGAKYLKLALEIDPNIPSKYLPKQ